MFPEKPRSPKGHSDAPSIGLNGGGGSSSKGH